jgi:hypothetical protein
MSFSFNKDLYYLQTYKYILVLKQALKDNRFKKGA